MRHVEDQTCTRRQARGNGFKLWWTRQVKHLLGEVLRRKIHHHLGIGAPHWFQYSRTPVIPVITVTEKAQRQHVCWVSSEDSHTAPSLQCEATNDEVFKRRLGGIAVTVVV